MASCVFNGVFYYSKPFLNKAEIFAAVVEPYIVVLYSWWNVFTFYQSLNHDVRSFVTLTSFKTKYGWIFYNSDNGTSREGNIKPSSPFNVGLTVGLCLGILSLVTCAVIERLWYKTSRRSKKVNVYAFHTCLCNKNNRKHEILPYFKLIFTWMTRIV